MPEFQGPVDEVKDKILAADLSACETIQGLEWGTGIGHPMKMFVKLSSEK